MADVADVVLATPFTDCAWCHTVGYTTALLAGAAIARELGVERIDADAAAALLGGAAARPRSRGDGRRARGRPRDPVRRRRHRPRDGRELALKLAEGARMPTAGLELETVLHGQLAGHDAADALILVGFADDERVARRGALVAAATRRSDCPRRPCSPPPRRRACPTG